MELVREDLRAIRNTAEAISEADDLPEFEERFRLPRSGSRWLLLAKAKGFLADALPHKALFIGFELPADFLEDLQADIALLETAKENKDAGLAEQVGRHGGAGGSRAGGHQAAQATHTDRKE